MRILYIHERYGALGGAEANACITASELKARGHPIGLLHGASTGKNEEGWQRAFGTSYLLPKKEGAEQTFRAIRDFKPDVIYVHKMAQLEVIEALINSKLPLVRMVHDHDIYCMRSYKYFYFSREICTRPASSYCLFPCGAFISRDHGSKLPLKVN